MTRVVIIGGGIIGCSTALALAARGADVTVLERGEIAHGASGRNHGLIFYPQDSVTDPLYRRTRELYSEMAASSPLDIALDTSPRGFIILVSKDSEWAPAEAEARACEAGGVKVEQLSADALFDAEPNVARHHLGGWFIDDGYRLDPAALTLSFAYAAREAGAEINTYVDVKQVITDGDRVTGVASDDGFIEADVVVDAAGPWAPKVARSAGVDLPISGARGWLLLTKRLPPMTNHLLESSGWHLTAGDPGPRAVTVGGYATGDDPAQANIGMLIQQNANGHVLLGGSRLASMREDPEGHDVTKVIAGKTAEAVPALASVPLVAVWSGVRPMSADGRPLIGWVGGVEGLFVTGGHGGQGIMLGGGSGELGAQIILGETHFTDPAPFDPTR